MGSLTIATTRPSPDSTMLLVVFPEASAASKSALYFSGSREKVPAAIRNWSNSRSVHPGFTFSADSPYIFM
jgi:hypothetical protein